MHASVTMGAGQVTWPWWDAPGDSAIGALMPGHSATDANNIATVQVSDRNHPSTKDLPDSYRFGDEHYTFSSNVRGTHHVLMTLDEETYNVGNGVTADGRRPPDRLVPDVRGRADLGLEPRPLLRRLPRERRRQQPDQAPRRRRPLRRRAPRARTPTATRTVWTNFSPHRARRRPARRDRPRHRARRQGLLDRDRRPGDAVRGPAADVRPGARARPARC